MAKRLTLVAAVAALIGGGAAAQENKPPRVRESQASIYAGQHVNNSWQDAFLDVDQLNWDDAGLVGLAYGYNWRRPGSVFSIGVELQTVYQFYEDDHNFELNLPVMFRVHANDDVPVVRSLAFGIGPSYSTSPSAYEIASRGDTQQLMVYWTLEAEFGPRHGNTSIFTRIHHRSGAFGTIADEDEGGSNAIVWGLRQRW
jgi:hypothetical protein